jgi:hypothetical protein
MSEVFPEPGADPIESLLPESDEVLSPEEEFALFEQSFDQDIAPDLVITEDEDVPTPVGRGWQFDFNKNRLVGGSSGHAPLATFGEETLKVWIVKVLQTARRAHPVYSDDYGIDALDDFLGGPIERFPTDEYHDAIREALLVNDNIEDVIDLQSRYDPDENWVALRFTVVRATGSLLAIETTVPL